MSDETVFVHDSEGLRAAVKDGLKPGNITYEETKTRIPILLNHKSNSVSSILGVAVSCPKGLFVTMREGHELTLAEIGGTFGNVGYDIHSGVVGDDGEPRFNEFLIREFSLGTFQGEELWKLVLEYRQAMQVVRDSKRFDLKLLQRAHDVKQRLLKLVENEAPPCKPKSTLKKNSKPPEDKTN